MTKKQRQSNIELLRIISMLGVIILHYNNKTIGGGLYYVTQNSINYYVLVILESTAICAVDLFMLISGYFSCRNTKTTLKKPTKLIIQVIAFSFLYNLLTGMAKNTLTIKSMIGSLIPANYFVILYITVYLLSPYLNLLYEIMNKEFIILLILLFSIWPTGVDVFQQITENEYIGLSTIGMYGSQYGYQIVNFIIMYYVGMYICKYITKLSEIKTHYIVLTLIDVIILLSIWTLISEYFGFDRNMAWIYCNPLVIIEAVLFFLIFSRLNMGCIEWINKLASASFSVFLAHAWFITRVKIEWAVKQNPLIMLGHIAISLSLIYIICFLIDVNFQSVYKILFKKFEKKKIVITQL